jgi:hypothetical protein
MIVKIINSIIIFTTDLRQSNIIMVISKQHIKYPTKNRIIAGSLILIYLFTGFAAYSHHHEECQNTTHEERSDQTYTLSHDEDEHSPLMFCPLCDLILNLNFDLSKYSFSIKPQEITSNISFQISNELCEIFLNPVAPRGPPQI